MVPVDPVDGLGVMAAIDFVEVAPIYGVDLHRLCAALKERFAATADRRREGRVAFRLPNTREQVGECLGLLMWPSGRLARHS